MVDRTGLHTAPVPGNPPLGTSPVDGRLVQAALFGALGQCLNGGGYAASGSTMAFTWNAGVYQIPDTANGGAVYHSPVDSAVLTPAAGQAGGRIDSIYVLQQDFEKNGTTSRVVYGIAAGVAGSGTAPSLSGIAGGPLRLANITVPAAATKATDCTVTWIVPPATLALDGAVLANKALLDLAPGTYVGQRSFAGGIDYRWTGTLWKAWDSDWMTANFGVVGPNGNEGANPGWVRNAGLYRYQAGQVRFQGGVSLNGGGATLNAEWQIGLPVNALTGTGKTGAGHCFARNASDGYRRWELIVGLNNATFIPYAFGGSAWRGAWDSTYPNAPFNETWGQSDSVEWDFLYDPA